MSVKGFLSMVTGLALFATAGCIKPPPPYVPAYRDPPKRIHCFDGTPHIAGSMPYALGGTCCCTPTDELMAKLHADNLCMDLDTQGLLNIYHQKGIQLATDHKNCNNLCQHGPHVTKGGKCMVAPTPGTRNYEEVATGVVLQPPPPAERKKQGSQMGK